MQPKIIALLGISGSGKGTQAKLLVKKFGLDYVGSGELLRVRQQISDFTGKKIKEVIGRGKFVSTAIIFGLWLQKWEELKNKPDYRGFVIDGSPRKLIEAELIDQTLQWYEWDKYFYVLLVCVSEEEATSRLLNRRMCGGCKKIIPYIGEFKHLERCDACGGELITRPDDTQEGVKNRIAEYKEHTVPVIEYYEKQGRLIRVNGEQSIEDVQRDILKALGIE